MVESCDDYELLVIGMTDGNTTELNSGNTLQTREYKLELGRAQNTVLIIKALLAAVLYSKCLYVKNFWTYRVLLKRVPTR